MTMTYLIQTYYCVFLKLSQVSNQFKYLLVHSVPMLFYSFFNLEKSSLFNILGDSMSDFKKYMNCEW